MAKEKKRLSKEAKAALKILNDSKLLASTKTSNEAKADQNFNSAGKLPKTTAANKMRPDKKRG